MIRFGPMGQKTKLKCHAQDSSSFLTHGSGQQVLVWGCMVLGTHVFAPWVFAVYGFHS